MRKGLLAIDLDGTLLGKNQTISPTNAAAISYAFEKGYEVVIATGRVLDNIHVAQLKELHIRYLICLNGALTIDLEKDQQIDRNPMDAKQAIQLWQALPKQQCYRAIYSKRKAFVNKNEEEVIHHLGFSTSNVESFQKSVCYLEDVVKEIQTKQHHIYKVSIDFQKGPFYHQNKEAMKQIIQQYPFFQAVSGGFDGLEFTATNVNKASAFQFLHRHLQLDPHSSIAIGDSENDLALLQMASLGIAMGNSETVLKKAADVLTDNCEHDGVGKAIYRWI